MKKCSWTPRGWSHDEWVWVGKVGLGGPITGKCWRYRPTHWVCNYILLIIFAFCCSASQYQLNAVTNLVGHLLVTNPLQSGRLSNDLQGIEDVEDAGTFLTTLHSSGRYRPLRLQWHPQDERKVNWKQASLQLYHIWYMKFQWGTGKTVTVTVVSP